MGKQALVKTLLVLAVTIALLGVAPRGVAYANQTTISSLKQDISMKDTVIQAKDNQIQGNQEILTKFSQQLSSLQLAVQARDQEIENNKKQIKALQKQLAELHRVTLDLEGQIERLAPKPVPHHPQPVPQVTAQQVQSPPVQQEKEVPKQEAKPAVQPVPLAVAPVKEHSKVKTVSVAPKQEPSSDAGYVSGWNVTFYSLNVESTGKRPGDTGYGETASGTTVKEGRTIACPRSLALGTRVDIEGYGVRVCEDRGGGVVGHSIDVYLANRSERELSNLGRQPVRIKILPQS